MLEPLPDGSQGEPFDFEPINEPWGEIALSDGTKVRIRVITKKVWKLHDRFDDKGNPIVAVETELLISSTKPKSKKGKSRAKDG